MDIGALTDALAALDGFLKAGPPDEPRDDQGRWTGAGGGTPSKPEILTGESDTTGYPFQVAVNPHPNALARIIGRDGYSAARFIAGGPDIAVAPSDGDGTHGDMWQLAKSQAHPIATTWPRAAGFIVGSHDVGVELGASDQVPLEHRIAGSSWDVAVVNQDHQPIPQTSWPAALLRVFGYGKKADDDWPDEWKAGPPDEPRDDHGRWSGGGAPSSQGLVKHERIVGTLGEVRINPPPAGMASMLDKSKYNYLRVLGMGPNIAVADVDAMVHAQMWAELQSAGHPLARDPLGFPQTRRFSVTSNPVAATEFPHTLGGKPVAIKDPMGLSAPVETWPEALRRAVLGPRTKAGDDTMTLETKAGPEDEPRDDHGRWTSGGGSSGGGGLAKSEVVAGKYPVEINPSTARLDELMSQRVNSRGYGEIRFVRIGDNIAISSHPHAIHSDIGETLLDAKHPLRGYMDPNTQHFFAYHFGKTDAAGKHVSTMVVTLKGGTASGLHSTKWPKALADAVVGMDHPIYPTPLTGSVKLPESKAGPVDEARDWHGRWTAGSGGVLESSRVLAAGAVVNVNPTQGQMAGVLSRQRSGRVHVLGVGDNIAVAGGDTTSHGAAWNALRAGNHVLGDVAGGYGATSRLIVQANSVPSDLYRHDFAGTNVGVFDLLGRPVAPSQWPSSLRSAIGAGIEDQPVRAADLSGEVKPYGWVERLRRWATGTDVPAVGDTSGDKWVARAQFRAGRAIQAPKPVPIADWSAALHAQRARNAATARQAYTHPAAASQNVPGQYSFDWNAPRRAANTKSQTAKALRRLMAMMHDIYAAPAELKFVGEASQGMIEGYASVNGNTDWHGDVVAPGAFDASLSEWATKGIMPGMYGEHSPYRTGGDPYPIGVWTEVTPDDKGLRVKGQLVGMEHPDVARIYALVKAGAIRGLSIAYNVSPGGAVIGRKAGEPKRLLKSVNLKSIDLVSNPSNPAALIDGIKSIMVQADQQTAVDHVGAALRLHQDCLDNGGELTQDDLTRMMMHLQEAHFALTGDTAPEAPKGAFSTIRDLEDWLHAPLAHGGRGLPNAKARELGELVFKTAPRDEGAKPNPAAKELQELTQTLAGFSLPSF